MNYELLQNQYLLLDTNIVINFGRYRKYYQSFVDSLLKHEITPLINDVVRVELLAFAKDADDTDKIIDLIEQLTRNKHQDITLPSSKDSFDYAIKLAQHYQRANVPVKHIQLPDLLIGADMCRFQKGGMLTLATENHDDFPHPIFERIGIEVVDCINSIHPIGFYRLAPSLQF